MKSYLSVFLFLGVISCQFGDYKAPVILEKPDFSVSYFRADKALFANNDDGLLNAEPFAGHPDFAQSYVENIMRFAPFNSPMLESQVDLYIEDAIWQGVQHEIDSVFGNTHLEEKELTKGLKNIAEKLPFITVPERVFFYNSGFNVAIFPDGRFLGIGLEWYLGKNSEYISMLPPSNYPMYKKEKMEKSNLVADALRGFLLFSLYTEKTEENALNTMVFYGKTLFALKQCTGMDDNQVLNYLESELEWAESNEGNTWKRMVAEEWLFSNDQKLMTQLTSNGPFTPGFPQDSPARLGWYTGYRMMCDFANEHKNENLKFIMDAPAEEVLKFYKP